MAKIKIRELTDEQRQKEIDALVEIAGLRIEIDKAVARKAAAFYSDKEIAETIQGLFGFSALTWKKAIEWYGNEWSEFDAVSNTALLYCASLPSKQAQILHDEIIRDHLSLAQIRERRDELKPSREKRTKICPHCGKKIK